MSGLLVAMECSQRDASIALRRGHGEVHSAEIDSSAGINERLLLVLSELLEKEDAQPSDISRLGVSIGPGGFTGLRVTISTAKMLSLTTGCEIVPVPTALVAARSADPTPGITAVALSSKRGATWLTRIHADGQIDGVPGMVESDQAQEALTGVSAVIADDALPEAFETATRQLGAARQPLVLDGTACLTLTEQGDPIDPHALVPLYGRQPEAVRLSELNDKRSKPLS